MAWTCSRYCLKISVRAHAVVAAAVVVAAAAAAAVVAAAQLRKKPLTSGGVCL